MAGKIVIYKHSNDGDHVRVGAYLGGDLLASTRIRKGQRPSDVSRALEGFGRTVAQHPRYTIEHRQRYQNKDALWRALDVQMRALTNPASCRARRNPPRNLLAVFRFKHNSGAVSSVSQFWRGGTTKAALMQAMAESDTPEKRCTGIALYTYGDGVTWRDYKEVKRNPLLRRKPKAQDHGAKWTVREARAYKPVTYVIAGSRAASHASASPYLKRNPGLPPLRPNTTDRARLAAGAMRWETARVVADLAFGRGMAAARRRDGSISEARLGALQRRLIRAQGAATAWRRALDRAR